MYKKDIVGLLLAMGLFAGCSSDSGNGDASDINATEVKAPEVAEVSKPEVLPLNALIESVDISLTALKINDLTEYDFRVFVTVSEQQKDLVQSMTLDFPDGQQYQIPKNSLNVFTEGREHQSAFGFEEEMGSHVWQYIDIARVNRESFPQGEYSLTMHYAGGHQTLPLPLMVEPGSAEPVSFPPFPALDNPPASVSEGQDVTFAVVPSDNEMFLFLGRPDPTGQQDFSHTREKLIPAGSESVGPLAFEPSGDWGGDLATAVNRSGDYKGVKWSASLSSGTTYELSVEADK